jgi:excisionase family DNA binding protein
MPRLEWVKVSEAARLLSCSADAIRTWADQGKLEFRRTPGLHRLISLVSIQKMIDNSYGSQERN